MGSALRQSINALKQVVRHPFGLGCYPNFLITSEGNCVCNVCCKKHFKTILTDQRHWRSRVDDVAQSAANFEGPIYCDICSADIVGEDE
jgi:hypothetical protein